MGLWVVRGEREKGSCGEGERVDGYGSTVKRANGYGRRGVDGWARPHRHHRWVGLGSSSLVLDSARHTGAGWALLVGASRVLSLVCVCARACERLCER